MTLTSTLPGIPSASRPAGWIGESLGEPAGVTDIRLIGYHMTFGCFKLAVVLEGIHARYLQHQTAGEGFEPEGQAVPTLVARAHQVVGADTR